MDTVGSARSPVLVQTAPVATWLVTGANRGIGLELARSSTGGGATP